MGLTLPDGAVLRLQAYLALLQKWNKVHNLTAVRQPEDMVTLHLLDSLAILPHLAGSRLLDVGSGGGLPGIPLAIARPEWQMALLDSNRKKAAFLRQAKTELGLSNVIVYSERVEDHQGEYDQVITRAFSTISEFVRLAGRLCTARGYLAAMKGVDPCNELKSLPVGWCVKKALELEIPGLEAERRLIILEHC